VKILEFIREMHMAYAAADVIISRAGALSISELCIVGKATVLIPSPNVAEDHQTRNARALTDHGAAWMLTDSDAPDQLAETVTQLLSDEGKRTSMGNAIKAFARPEATKAIVEEIIKIIKR
jgi:UDP-N-acetylglucosamine--N-acetylmuramyl-(pentapeptide) pyrophosphoryl-undecaprenol N-acetylglucosamine transferase